jgi:hypothetical protein
LNPLRISTKVWLSSTVCVREREWSSPQSLHTVLGTGRYHVEGYLRGEGQSSRSEPQLAACGTPCRIPHQRTVSSRPNPNREPCALEERDNKGIIRATHGVYTPARSSCASIVGIQEVPPFNLDSSLPTARPFGSVRPATATAKSRTNNAFIAIELARTDARRIDSGAAHQMLRAVPRTASAPACLPAAVARRTSVRPAPHSLAAHARPRRARLGPQAPSAAGGNGGAAGGDGTPHLPRQPCMHHPARMAPPSIQPPGPTHVQTPHVGASTCRGNWRSCSQSALHIPTHHAHFSLHAGGQGPCASGFTHWIRCREARWSMVAATCVRCCHHQQLLLLLREGGRPARSVNTSDTSPALTRPGRSRCRSDAQHAESTTHGRCSGSVLVGP